MFVHRVRHVAAALLAVVLSFATIPISAAPAFVTEVEGISEYRFDNGLRALLFPEQSSPQITVSITYFVGSAHEGLGEEGLAHFLEHMLFKGTEKNKHILQLVDSRGGMVNGTTWYDRTMYYESLPSTDATNLEFALSLEADRMRNAAFDIEEFDRERTVVCNELDLGESTPTSILSDRIIRAAYTWHPYGHPVIGYKENIVNVSQERLRQFYDTYYQPDNALLMIAGDFEPDQALALIDQYFSPIPKPERALPVLAFTEPPQDGARRVELSRMGDIASIGLVYHIPPGSHADYPALVLLAMLACQQPYGVLYQQMSRPGLIADLYGTASRRRYPGVIWFGAEVPNGQSPEVALEKMQQQLESLAEAGFTEENLDRAKTEMATEVAIQQRSARWFGMQLSEAAAVGDWRLWFLIRDRLKAVTLDDITRVATAYLRADNRTAGIFLPTKQPGKVEIPAAPNLDDVLAAYSGGEAMVQGEMIDTSPMELEDRMLRSSLDTGLKLAMLPRQSRGNVVRGQLAFKLATPEAIVANRPTLSVLSQMLMRGTANRSYQQILDEISKLQAQLLILGAGGQDVTMFFECSRATLPDLMVLIADIAQNPVFPEDELEIVKAEAVSRCESSRSDPFSISMNEAERRSNPYPISDPRYVATFDDQIAWIKAADTAGLKQFHADYFGSGSAFLTLIGDFDPESTATMAKDLFGNWIAPLPYERIKREYRGDIQAQDIEIETPDKDSASVWTSINVKIRDDASEYPALYLANFILGGYSDSRLHNTFREQEGLGYYAFSYLVADSQDRTGRWIMAAACSPADTEKTVEILRAQLGDLSQNGPTPEELAAAQKAYALSEQNSMNFDSTLSFLITDQQINGRTFAYTEWLNDEIAKLTPEKIRAAVKKHLQFKRLIVVRAGDFQGKLKAGAE